MYSLFLPEKNQLIFSSILSYMYILIYHIFLTYINYSNHYSNILFLKIALNSIQFDVGPCVWGKCHFGPDLKHYKASFEFLG